MPALHVYFPSSTDRDAAWAFASVREALEGWPVVFDVTVNPITQQENLKVVVDGVYRLTVSFESGDAVDADLAHLTGIERTGHSRFRVVSGPDPENAYSDVIVELLALADSLGPVLVYGLGAQQVFTDTLTPAPAAGP